MKYLLTSLIFLTIASSAYANNYSCGARMIDQYGRGRIVQQFMSYSRYSMSDACNRSMSDCRIDLSYRQRRGVNRAAICVGQFNNPPRPYPPRPYPPRPPRVVTRYCTYNIIESDWNGSWIVDRVTRSVTAPINSGVYQKACNIAANDCRRMRRYNQRCERELRR